MTGLTEAGLIFVVFLGIFLLGTYRLGTMIQMFALQAFVLSLMPFLPDGPGRRFFKRIMTSRS